MKKTAIILLILVGLLSCSLLACTHIHSYEGWEYDETNHWRECECGQKFEFVAHSLNEKGVCNCGYNEKIGLDGHTHSYGEWKFDDSEHWKECSVCDREAQRGGHVFDETGTCEICRTQAATAELKYALNADGNSYTVAKIESKDVNFIKVPSLYEGKPVTAIGEEAFKDCKNLTEIYMNVTAIGKEAFYGCEKLSSVTTEAVTSIGENAFYGCSRLTEITIDNVTELGEGAFEGCSSLAKVSINGVTTISKKAFYGCLALTDISMRGLTTIDESAFYNCVALEGVSLPSTVKVIGARAFANCLGLRTVSVPNGITTIGYDAFYNCDSLIYTADSEGNGLYLGNASNRYLIFMAVKENSDTCSVRDEAKIIYHEAFAGSKSLQSVQIGSGVTTIGERIFSGCSELVSIGVSSFNFRFSAVNNCLINSNNTLIAGCQSSTIPASGVTKIGKYAFLGCDELRAVTIPSSVTSIEESAFEGCAGLQQIEIPSSVKSVGDGAFSRCNVLSELTVKSGVESIGARAFIECKNLTSITIPSSVTKIGERAFELCTGLKNAKIEGAAELGDDVFFGCYGLENIVALNATSIGKSAFAGCEQLKSVALGSRVTEIPAEAFVNCNMLGAIYFKGTAAAWNKVVIGENNSALELAAVYYYSEQEPTAEQWNESAYWWYLLDGEPTKWTQQ